MASSDCAAVRGGQIVVAAPAVEPAEAAPAEDEALVEVTEEGGAGATSSSFTTRQPTERWTHEETRKRGAAPSSFAMGRVASSGRVLSSTRAEES